MIGPRDISGKSSCRPGPSSWMGWLTEPVILVFFTVPRTLNASWRLSLDQIRREQSFGSDLVKRSKV